MIDVLGYASSTRPTGEFAQRLADAVREIVLKAWRRPDSCIESTRIAVQVARRIGLAAAPVPTTCLLATRTWYDSGGTRGHSVIAGTGTVNPDTASWDGHLIAHLDGAWLLDIAADQLHRPAHGINILRPIVVPATRDELRAGMVRRLHDGLVVSYREVPDRTWRSAPGWAAYPQLVEAAVVQVLRRLGPATW